MTHSAWRLQKGLDPRKGSGCPCNVYRCVAITNSEEFELKYNIPEEYTDCNAQWKQALDSYAAEIAPPVPRTWGKRLLQEVFGKPLQVSHAACKPVNLIWCDLFSPSPHSLPDMIIWPDSPYIKSRIMTAVVQCEAQYKRNSILPAAGVTYTIVYKGHAFSKDLMGARHLCR